MQTFAGCCGPEQTVELPVIWDAVARMWRHSYKLPYKMGNYKKNKLTRISPFYYNRISVGFDVFPFTRSQWRHTRVEVSEISGN